MEPVKIKRTLFRAFILMSVILLATMGSCVYENEEDLYPPGSENCDTTNITYSGTVYPIIRDNCFICHTGSAPQGNIHLDDYSYISTAARIPPGQRGSLYGAITHDPNNFPMPWNATQLSECKIKQIHIWIVSGTPEN